MTNWWLSLVERTCMKAFWVETNLQDPFINSQCISIIYLFTLIWDFFSNILSDIFSNRQQHFRQEDMTCWVRNCTVSFSNEYKWSNIPIRNKHTEPSEVLLWPRKEWRGVTATGKYMATRNEQQTLVDQMNLLNVNTLLPIINIHGSYS